MRTAKQLVLATLTDLGGEIVKHQIELVHLKQEWNDLVDMVIATEDEMDTLRLTIKALKDRAQWNQREGERLGLAQPEPPLALPEAPPQRDPEDQAGEEWKGS